jgi:hypothetical protein
VFLLAVPVMPLVGSPERMEEAIFPALVVCAVAATTDRPPLLALANVLFVARIGGDARLPPVVAWLGLLLACALAALSYARAWLPFPRSAPVRLSGQPSAAALPPP